jgi:hypothetical protein
MGIFLQIVYLTTKTLLAPMLLHALHNFLAIVVARPKLFSGDLQSWLVGINRGELLSPLLLLSAFAAATTICLLLYLTRTRWRLPNGAVWNPGYVTAETPPTMLKARARLR